MTFLPIVARELRVTARKRSTYWIRFSAAAVAMAVCGWSFIFFTQMGAASMAGKMLFGGAVGLAWFYAVIGGVFKTADTLSEEKRDGTLGLLFLTDLRGYDIVLGKMVAASVNWFFGLIALFPVMALSLLMGGVAPGEFWRSIVGLTNLLFYSLALGMFVSSFSRNERRAAGLTIGLLVLLLWLPSSLAEWQQHRTGATVPPLGLVLPDVLSPMRFASDYEYGRQPQLFWQSLAASHGVGWLFIALASLIVPRTWQQPSGRVARWEEQAGQFSYGRNATRRRRFRQRALELNPFYWVAARARGQSVSILAVLLLACAGFLFWFVQDPQDWTNEDSYLFATFCLHSIIKVWLALAACRRFVDDRRSGALELILCTPLTTGEVVRGQWLALGRQFLGPILLVLVADTLLLCFGSYAVNYRLPRDQALFALMFGANVIVFLADIVALGLLSMWRGLKSRHSYTAWLWCVVQVLALPWVIFYVGLTVFFMLAFLPRVMTQANANTGWTQTLMDYMAFFMTGMWFVGCMAMAILSAWWAWRCLRSKFREQVTGVFTAGAPFRARPTPVPPTLPSPAERV